MSFTQPPWPKIDFETGQMALFWPAMKGNVYLILWNGVFLTLDKRYV